MVNRYHTVDGVRVFCGSEGQGDPVLLVHGFLTSHRIWEAVISRLGKRFMVFAPDLPGFGESDRPEHYSYSIDALAGTVGGLMDQLGVSQAAVVGHGLGGAVALALAAANPERVQRAGVIAPRVFAAPLPPEWRVGLFPLVGETLLGRTLTRSGLGRLWRRLVYAGPRLPDEEKLQYHWECLDRPGGRRVALRVLETLASPERMEAVPGRVSCPVLVIWGEADEMLPVVHGKRLLSELHRGRMVTLPAVGHCPMEEHPQELCEVLEPFLDGDA